MDQLGSAIGRFNLFDWFIVLVWLVSSGYGIARGFAREALSIIGWVSAFLLANVAAGSVSDLARNLIDEPTKGLAPAIISTMAGALRDLKAKGASILLVEQNFAVARALGDTAAVMDDGRIVWAGEMDELAGDSTLQERLMGLSMEAH